MVPYRDNLEPIDPRYQGPVSTLGGADALQDPGLDHLDGRGTLLTRRLFGGVGDQDGQGFDLFDDLGDGLGVCRFETADDDERDVGAWCITSSVGSLTARRDDLFSAQQSRDLCEGGLGVGTDMDDCFFLVREGLRLGCCF